MRLLVLIATLIVGTASVLVLSGRFQILVDQGLAFDGLQGFGANTIGGRGGRVVAVTTLDDSGKGSLRWALEDLSEPRIIQFDVAGVIQLKDQIQIGANVTVNGMDAPGPVTITGARLRVVGNNVIVRGLHIRPGSGRGSPKDNRDAISVGKADTTVENVVIDSNSLTWALDESLSIWGDVRNVTVSNNIIAEALDHAGHSKGGHSMGMLIGGGGAQRVSVFGNFLASNRNRNPTIKDDSQEIEFINNLVYNWGENAFTAQNSSVHIIGNVYLAGKDSLKRPPIRLKESSGGIPHFYLADNVGAIDYAGKLASAPVFRESGVTVRPSGDVKDWVLSNAGARTPELDAVDARLVAGVSNDTGRIIDTPADVDGLEAIQTSRQRVEADIAGQKKTVVQNP